MFKLKTNQKKEKKAGFVREFAFRTRCVLSCALLSGFLCALL